VFTARYGLSSYITQTRFVRKGLQFRLHGFNIPTALTPVPAKHDAVGHNDLTISISLVRGTKHKGRRYARHGLTITILFLMYTNSCKAQQTCFADIISYEHDKRCTFNLLAPEFYI
jgi:hypothetical protein